MQVFISDSLNYIWFWCSVFCMLIFPVLCTKCLLFQFLFFFPILIVFVQTPLECGWRENLFSKGILSSEESSICLRPFEYWYVLHLLLFLVKQRIFLVVDAKPLSQFDECCNLFHIHLERRLYRCHYHPGVGREPNVHDYIVLQFHNLYLRNLILLNNWEVPWYLAEHQDCKGIFYNVNIPMSS